MNELRLIAFASIVAILTSACGGGGGSNSGNDDVTTPVEPSSPTMAKDILFSELMVDPVFIPDFNGEWFEIRNPGTDKFNLRDCVFSNAASNFIINVEFIIGIGEYKTFAISAIPGFVPDINYSGSGLTLDNLAGTLTMTCNGREIDSRQYFSPHPGSSSSLSNNGNVWCDDRGSSYGLGDTGTPGSANIVC